MEDSKNHKLYYVMWLPKAKNIVWDAADKKPLPRNQAVDGFELYGLLQKHIDLAKWRRQYASRYKNWLENDDQTVFDLKNPVATRLLAALKKTNAELPPSIRLGYWHDIDRSLDESFRWEKSPLSGRPLINLGNGFCALGRLWDPENYLVLPETV